MQFFDQLRMKLIQVTSRVLQTRLKYFNGTIISSLKYCHKRAEMFCNNYQYILLNYTSVSQHQRLLNYPVVFLSNGALF